MLMVNDRVLIKPLGVKGTIVRPGKLPGLWVAQADSGGPPLPWHASELDRLAEGR